MKNSSNEKTKTFAELTSGASKESMYRSCTQEKGRKRMKVTVKNSTATATVKVTVRGIRKHVQNNNEKTFAWLLKVANQSHRSERVYGFQTIR